MSHFTLNMMNEIFHSSTFKNLSMNWGKYVFHWEKWNFQCISKFAHTTELLTLGKAQLILLPLYLQMLIMQILTKYAKYLLFF